MTELIDWLRVQLDEDERLANAAADGHPHWRADDDGDVSAEGTGGNGYLANGPWGGSLHDAGHHIARHDPARVLRQVERDRRILEHCSEMLRPDPAWGGPTDPDSVDPGAWHVVKLLALPYADRPGYRSEWAP